MLKQQICEHMCEVLGLRNQQSTRAKTHSGPDRQYSRTPNQFFRCLLLRQCLHLLKVDIPLLSSPRRQQQFVTVLIVNLGVCNRERLKQMFDTSVPQIVGNIVEVMRIIPQECVPKAHRRTDLRCGCASDSGGSRRGDSAQLRRTASLCASLILWFLRPRNETLR